MKLVINGEARSFDLPLTLAGLLEQLGMKQDRVAVELNRTIVTREKWGETNLSEGDRLEIVHFVGGEIGRASCRERGWIWVGRGGMYATDKAKYRRHRK